MADTGPFGSLAPKRLVNRQDEIDAIGAALAPSDDKPRIFYFEGGAGVGKSRLLCYACRKFEKLATFAGFYDFDETELHSNSVLERQLLDALDPDREHFTAFREERQRYLEARRTGVPENKLETQRQKLADLFVEGINELGAHKKILICFDTVETLQRESDTVEFPQEIQTAIEKLAIEMFGWLTRNLPKMGNVVVLLAGRPKEGLDEQFQRAFGSVYRKFDLSNFNPAYVKEYLDVMAETYADAGRAAEARQFHTLAADPDRVHTLTDGQPILLSFVTDLIDNSVELPKEFDLTTPLDDDTPEKKEKLRAKIKADLMERVQNDIDKSQRISFVLPYIALLRKGVTPEILSRALQPDLPEWDRDCCAEVLESMRGLSFAKPKPSNPNPDLPLERMHLHDEVYDVMGEGVIGPHIEQYVTMCRRMVTYYEEQVEAAEFKLRQWQKTHRSLKPEDEEAAFEEQGVLTAQSNRLKAKRLYYELEADPFEGYAAYSRISDQAIINHQVGLDMMLRDEMLRYFDLTHPNNWRLKRAGKEPKTRLTTERIMRGAGIRWVQRLNAHGQAAPAIAAAQVLQTDANVRTKLKAQDDPLFDGILKTYQGEAYLKSDTSRAIEVLNDAIELFDQAKIDPKYPDLRNTLRPRHLGRAYNNRGYAHVRENRFHEAVHDYQQALPLLRETGLPHQTAGTLNNLAFAYANTGQLLAAEILSQEAIRTCQDEKLDHLLGLALNTAAILELFADRPHRAAALAARAIEVFESVTQGGDPRGMGLASLVLGKADRARAQLGIYDEHETTRLFAAGETAIKSGHETFRTGTDWHEPARESEALQALGCLYRQWALYEKNRANGSVARVEELAGASQTLFDSAIAGVTDKSIGVRADVLNDLAELWWNQGDKTRALEYADQSDDAVRKRDPNYMIQARKKPAEPWFQLYVILGKNELLRAHIALQEQALGEAAQHYTAASAYFDRFEGDASARALAARRIYRIYRDLLDAGLSAKELDQFRQRVETFQRQTLVPPWPQRTTTLSENFGAVWSDLHLVLEA